MAHEVIAASLDRVANSITPSNAAAGPDESGISVGCLTEAVMGMTAALLRIAEAITDLASAKREGNRNEHG